MPVLVIPSCTVEVIGDDVHGVCERVCRETGRTVVYFNMGGFLKGGNYLAALKASRARAFLQRNSPVGPLFNYGLHRSNFSRY